MSWTVEFHPECEMWADSLAVDDQEALLASIRLLRSLGPALGRPLVDTVKGSRHKNMKELRPPSSGGSEIRVLFAFDPTRTAVLLLGGDKSADWRGWYHATIPIADNRYDEHLEGIETRSEVPVAGRGPRKKSRKRRRQ